MADTSAARIRTGANHWVLQSTEHNGEHVHDHAAKTLGRVPRHLLAHLRRLRQRGAGGGVPAARHRLRRRRARLRPDGAHHGLCGRPHLRRAFQPGGHGGPGRRRTVPDRERSALRRHAGGGRSGCGRGALPRGIRQARLRDGGLRVQRLRRPQPGQVRHDVRPGDRGGADLLLPAGDPRLHQLAGAGRLRAHRHRAGADADPPDLDPRHQHLGQPGPQHRPRAVRRRRLRGAALAVLAGAHGRRRARRRRRADAVPGGRPDPAARPVGAAGEAAHRFTPRVAAGPRGAGRLLVQNGSSTSSSCCP